MRLLIAWPDPQSACLIAQLMENAGWQTEQLHDGRALLPWRRTCDVLLLHHCLPGLDGLHAGCLLADSAPVQPPRVLFVSPPEWCSVRPAWADCTVGSGVSVHCLCHLITMLAKKPLPSMAAAQKTLLIPLIETFLDELAFSPHLKGRLYTAWLLTSIIPSTTEGGPALQTLYRDCARVFSTTPAAVERCVRVAVESVFTQGNLKAIERFFGATVDPERGKPTNRAFLLQAAQQLRYSLTASRSPNSSEMHHSPAAPTSV